MRISFINTWHICICLFFIHYTTNTLIASVKIFTTHIDEYTQEVRVVFTLNKKDFLYKDFISFFIGHPLITISPWKTYSQTCVYYDPLFKENKDVFKDSVTLSTILTAKTIITEPIYFYCTYYQKSAHKIQECVHKITFMQNNQEHNSLATITPYAVSMHQKKYISTHSIPFNIHLIHLFEVCTQLIASFIYFLMYALCTISLIILLVLYFLRKKIYHNLFINSDIMIATITIAFIFVSSLLFCTYPSTNSPLINTFFVFIVPGMGMYYLKKSTDNTVKTFQAFCKYCGTLLVTATVPLLCKLIANALF